MSDLNLLIKEAIQEGNLHALRFLCKRLAEGTCLLPIVVEIAAMYGHLDIVRYLVEEAKVQDPNKADKDGWTSIHIAALKGHVDVVRYLVEEAKVQDPNKPDKDGWTSIHIAAMHGHLDVVRYLVEQGKVDPDKSVNNGYTLIWLAARNGHFEVVRYLVEEAKADPFWAPYFVHHSTHSIAAQYGHSELSDYLYRKVNPSIEEKPKIEDTTYYGFYSETQKEVTGKYFFYLNSAGKKVCVTEVRKENNPSFPDAVYVGQVVEFLGAEKSLKRWSLSCFKK